MNSTIERIARGRTDLVFDWIAVGESASAKDSDGTSLIQWCAYYGDISSIRFLLAHGEALTALGENFDLNGAAFHGHWQLCQFLIERGADANHANADSGERSLHVAISKRDPLICHRVVKVLLSGGAEPNVFTNNSKETGCFMRDCRTKGETPLHRAAAFGNEKIIQLLLSAGATVDARDMFGDTPLSWASWSLQPDSVLRLLCYGDHSIRESRDPDGMAAYLLGE